MTSNDNTGNNTSGAAGGHLNDPYANYRGSWQSYGYTNAGAPDPWVWAAKVLKVDFGASAVEVKKAYRREAIYWHPDQGRGRTSDFEAVKRAYAILQTPKPIRPGTLNVDQPAAAEQQHAEPLQLETNRPFYVVEHLDVVELAEPGRRRIWWPPLVAGPTVAVLVVIAAVIIGPSVVTVVFAAVVAGQVAALGVWTAFGRPAPFSWSAWRRTPQTATEQTRFQYVNREQGVQVWSGDQQSGPQAWTGYNQQGYGQYGQQWPAQPGYGQPYGQQPNGWTGNQQPPPTNEGWSGNNPNGGPHQ